MTRPVAMPEPLVVEDWGRDQIDLRYKIPQAQARITEIHHKEDGCVDDTPCFVFVSAIPGAIHVISQITLNTLNYNLKKLGYEVVKR